MTIEGDVITSFHYHIDAKREHLAGILERHLIFKFQTGVTLVSALDSDETAIAGNTYPYSSLRVDIEITLRYINMARGHIYERVIFDEIFMFDFE